MEEVNASHALQEVASVKKMVLHTELIVLPASWQESQHYMKEKQQGMHSRGGLSTEIPCGWRMKKILYGSIAWYTTMVLG